MKFDYVIQNPPYGKHGSPLHMKFVDECLKFSDKQFVVMPFNMVIQPTNNIIKRFKESFSKRLVEVDEMTLGDFKDVSSFSTVGIYEFKETSDKIHIIFKNGEEKTVDHLNKANKFNTYEEAFIGYLDNHGNIDAEWAGGHDHCTINTLGRQGITDLEEAWRIIDKDIENNCRKLKDGKFLLQCSENGFNQDGNFFGTIGVGNIYGSKEEVVEAMKAWGRTHTKGLNFIMFNSLKAAENCKAALMRPLMRLCLYRTQYTRLIGIKNNYKYIPDINWEDDKTKTDEGILELCGCPVDKAKEFVEYCRKKMDEVDLYMKN